jgi:signal transduction histidine kinase
MQVILNLMSNAIKFSQKDTKVIVTVQLTADSNGMLFSISDTGPGVPEEFRERIFQPFEQAPSSHAKEGTGLGLAICKLIVEAHGGKIWVEPKDDGSVFKFELPKRS